MITDTLKKIMKKNKCTEVVAKKLLRALEIQKLSSTHNIHHVQAEILWHEQNSKAGINCEITLGRILRSWGLNARRMPRSGNTSKKTKRPRATPAKPCDIKLTVDNLPILIESKLRSSPKALYDDIQRKPKCYHIHYEQHDYYVLPQDDFRKLIVDLDYPCITETDRGVKFYHDLFNQTADKTKYIDIVSLKQKTFDYMFIIRPNTMQRLLDRCIRY